MICQLSRTSTVRPFRASISDLAVSVFLRKLVIKQGEAGHDESAAPIPRPRVMVVHAPEIAEQNARRIDLVNLRRPGLLPPPAIALLWHARRCPGIVGLIMVATPLPRCPIP